eukprot:snap_masked-scaffold809_size94238-processed-gene-0.11 protein:Tk02711 transcript:snap_masked-scaffold809_size94238-processed-gene-0.11-mRNA-1 annotation:"protein toll-like"
MKTNLKHLGLPSLFYCFCIGFSWIDTFSGTSVFVAGQPGDSDPGCPVIHPGCACEEYNGGHDVWCPDRKEHNFQIHYKVGQAWLVCSPDKSLTEADLILTVQAIDLAQTESLSVQSCPLLTVPYIRLTQALNISGLKELRLVHTSTRSQPLRDGLFQGMESLTALKLQNIDIDNYMPLAFQGLSNLKTLSLAGGVAQGIPESLFAPLLNLEYLELFEQSLESLPEAMFANNSKLKHFSLSGTKIAGFAPKFFRPCKSLSSLSLKSISIGEEGIPSGLFDFNTKLQKVSVIGKGFEHAPDLLFAKTALEFFEWSLLRCPSRSDCQLALGDFLRNSAHLREFSLIRGLRTKLTLSETFFTNCSKLEKVEIVNAGLLALPPLLFRNNIELKHLDLRANELTSLPDEGLQSQTDLKYLDLRSNQLSAINGKVFSNLRDMRQLNVANNRISNLDPNAFFAMTKLELLNLTQNQIQFTDQTIFKSTSLTELQYLDLSHNNIALASLPDAWKYEMTSLHLLDLSHNSIGPVVDAMSLKFLSRSAKIDLAFNAIERIDFLSALKVPNALEPKSGDKSQDTDKPLITVSHNPFNCDCQALDLASFVNRDLGPLQSWYDIDASSASCASPSKHINKTFVSLSYDEFSCQFPSPEAQMNQTCPFQCICYFTPHNKKTFINCEGQSLGKMPSNIPQIPNMTISLNMEGNKLQSLDHGDSNFRLSSITELDLSNNAIQKLVFTDLPTQLTYLALKNNSLTTFDEDTLAFFRQLDTIELGLNQYECSCDSRTLFEFARRYQNLIRDINNVTIVCEGVPKPILEIQLDEFCYDHWKHLVNIVLPLVVVILLLVLLALLCIIKQDLILIWVYSQPRLRLFFSEDRMDKDRPYDAFISYANEDRDFVEEKLVPELESGTDIKYKCCIHCRDFDVGRNISEQIKESVDNSRRTIIILSKNFVRSTWCDEEFSLAHKRKRVIVVVFGEVPGSREMGPLLQNYLKSHTYLKHDDPWFWEKLKFRLPHRGAPSNPFARKNRTIDQVQLIESNINGRRNPSFVGSNGTIFVQASPPNTAESNGRPPVQQVPA